MVVAHPLHTPLRVFNTKFYRFKYKEQLHEENTTGFYIN